MALAAVQVEGEEKQMVAASEDRVVGIETERGHDVANAEEESEEKNERGNQVSNENGTARVGISLFDDDGEQIIVECDVLGEIMHEWDLSMEGITSGGGERRNILEEAMERAGIVVGNGLYEPMDLDEEHI